MKIYYLICSLLGHVRNQMKRQIVKIFKAKIRIPWQHRLQLKEGKTKSKPRFHFIKFLLFIPKFLIRYKVIARAKQENLFAEETCEIIVVDGVVPQITMSSIKNQHFEIPAGSPVHIEANTAGLKAGCELKWKTVKAENLAYFDESLVVWKY